MRHGSADVCPAPCSDAGQADDRDTQQLRAELAQSREETIQLRLEKAAMCEGLAATRQRRRDAGLKGGRPRKIPKTICAEFEELTKAGRSPCEAKSVLRRRYGCTSQGLGKALCRDAPKKPKPK